MKPLAQLQRSTIRNLLLAAGALLLAVKYSRMSHFGSSTGLLIDTGVLLDTPGCSVHLQPRPFSDQTTSAHSQVCVGREPPVTFDLDRAFMNYARLENTYGIHSFGDVSCFYAALDTVDDGFASERRPRSFDKAWQEIVTGMWIDSEYIRLRCLHNDQAIYDGLHLVARRRSWPETTGVVQKARNKHNVVVISVGATSRSDLERNFRYTASFLRHSLEAHELHGYSAVGSGSFPSAAAFLGGMTAGEAWARSSGSFYDVLPLLWKDYKKQGHWTLYVEETPSDGAFVDPVDRGFLRKPTDHYPLDIASQMSVPDKAARSLEPDVGISNDQPSICSGYRLRSKALLNYAADLIRASDGQPFFAFINLKDSSRDGANAQVLDKPLKTFLANLKRQNVSVETTVVLLSDIGKSHWDTGIAGDGSGLPFCFIKLAPLLVERYPSVSSSLSVNQHRLTTPYDVHATLKALATFPGELRLQPTRHGQSLFAPISTNRTCLDASVPNEFCACVEGPHVNSPQVSPETLPLARRALEFVNNATSSLVQLKDYCATFALWRVEYVDENPSPVTTATSTNASASAKVLMILSTVPRAIFSVRARRIAASIEDKSGNDESFHKLEIMDVDRIDRYANDDSKCIKFVNAKVRRYCYCKDIALQATT